MVYNTLEIQKLLTDNKCTIIGLEPLAFVFNSGFYSFNYNGKLDLKPLLSEEEKQTIAYIEKQVNAILRRKKVEHLEGLIKEKEREIADLRNQIDDLANKC